MKRNRWDFPGLFEPVIVNINRNNESRTMVRQRPFAAGTRSRLDSAQAESSID
jgi:hypothetical protein